MFGKTGTDPSPYMFSPFVFQFMILYNYDEYFNLESPIIDHVALILQYVNKFYSNFSNST